MGDNRFVEIAFGVNRRNIIIPIDQLSAAVKHAREKNSELYRSYFVFDEEIDRYVKRNHSVSGYRGGKFYLDAIRLDIDKGEDSDEQVYFRTRGAVLELQDEWSIPDEEMNLYYSGTGYHIEIPDIFGFGEMNFSDLVKVKATLSKHFPFSDDIYYNTSLIRVAGTINKKVKRYKIPITIGDILSGNYQDVISLSSNGHYIDADVTMEKHSSTIVGKDSDKIVLEVPKFGNTVGPSTVQFRTAEASRIVTCVQKMYDGGPQTGSRHNMIMRMTSAFRRAGVPKAAIIEMMQKWASSLPPDQVAKHVSDVFDKGYRYGCHDVLMAKYCSIQCIHFRKKDYGLEASTTQDMVQKYKEYLATVEAGQTIDLANIYNMQHEFKMLPGDYVTVTGDSGIGKTAWVQNIVVALKNVKVLYLSLEVGEPLIFRRFLQIANGLSKDEVDNALGTFSDTMLQPLIKPISHIKVTTIPPTLQAVEKMINEEGANLVVIDVIDSLDVEATTETEMTRIIARELKRIANATASVIIGIHHISKHAAVDESGKRRKLNMHSLKGSSAIEQKGDQVIGIEANGDNDTTLRLISVLKARDQKPFRNMPFHYDFNTFQYRQIKSEFRKIDGEKVIL